MTRRVAFFVAVLALSACGGGKQAMFTNPVYRADFPDPFVLKVGDTYYAYATNGAGKQVQTLTSNDLVHWQPGPDALPKVGSWGFNGETWAPEVLKRDDGSYVLYYTANHCVGRAVATKPLGPFVDPAKQPLVCQSKLGGSIDPSPFRDDDGKLFLLWKNDGNAIGAPTYIYAQRLSSDGVHLAGKRTTIEKNDVPWEASIVEGPMLRKHDGRYYLFYSGNVYSGAGYAVGYAVVRLAARAVQGRTGEPDPQDDVRGARAGAQRADRRRRGHDVDRLPRLGRRPIRSGSSGSTGSSGKAGSPSSTADLRRAGRTDAVTARASLDGTWEVQLEPGDAWREIRVPFTFEAPLSGIGTPEEVHERLRYRRTFRVPDEWQEHTIAVLRRGRLARARVRSTAASSARHEGGYARFALDAGKAGPRQRARARRRRPSIRPTTRSGSRKASSAAVSGIWYTRTTGIWQSVWIEGVPNINSAIFLRY